MRIGSCVGLPLLQLDVDTAVLLSSSGTFSAVGPYGRRFYEKAVKLEAHNTRSR